MAQLTINDLLPKKVCDGDGVCLCECMCVCHTFDGKLVDRESTSLMKLILDLKISEVSIDQSLKFSNDSDTKR